MASYNLSSTLLTYAYYNKFWLTQIHIILTLFIFISSTLPPNLQILVIFNNSKFVELATLVIDTLFYMLSSLLKYHYSHILLTLKAISINLHLSFKIDKELRISNHIDHYFLMNTLPQEFIYS